MGPVAEQPDLTEFRRQQLDIYVPAGSSGFWQGALRDPHEPGYEEVCRAVEDQRPLWIDLLYGDEEGAQRAVVRFLSTPWPDDGGRRVQALRDWRLDDGPAL